MPRVSVVIPCYNLGAFLGDALASVRAQTLGEVEILVVDDGSDDPGTLETLAAIEQQGVQVLRTVNLGVAAARNRGISAASGVYILPLDADDRIAATYLQKAAAILDAQPEVGIVYCRAELFGARQGEWRMPEFSLPHHLLDNLIFSAAMFRREDWLRAGGYDETMRDGWEDWEFWIRLLGLGRDVVRLPEPLFSYRIRHGSREQSLDFCCKIRLLLKIVWSNRTLYLAHFGAIARILLTGDRRCPDAIKVDHG